MRRASLFCDNCGSALCVDDDVAVLICATCGWAHEPGQGGPVHYLPLAAAATTALAVAGDVHLLAVWRLSVAVSTRAEEAWERIRKAAAPRAAFVYVPAFSRLRATAQQLGASLTMTQPQLMLDRGLEASNTYSRGLIGVGAMPDPDEKPDGHRGLQDESAADVAAEPRFGTFSPVVVGRSEARMLGHLVFLAVESHEPRELHAVDQRLEVVTEELVFIPAVWDPRYVHECNWRLLLQEFDNLVA